GRGSCPRRQVAAVLAMAGSTGRQDRRPRVGPTCSATGLTQAKVLGFPTRRARAGGAFVALRRPEGGTRMTTPALETAAPRTASLPDGRNLGYKDFGDPNGRPVFAFHGWPGSSEMFSVADGVAREKGVRVISVERPGMGASTFQPNRKLLDW